MTDDDDPSASADQRPVKIVNVDTARVVVLQTVVAGAGAKNYRTAAKLHSVRERTLIIITRVFDRLAVSVD